MAFNETLHKRGTGAQGGQFVASDGTKSKSIGYDGKRGSGYASKGGDSNVKALQKELNRLGILDSQGKKLAVDGKFGPKTTSAVRRLQKKLGLPVDGKVTPALLKKIKGLKPSGRDQRVTSERLKKAAKKAAPAKKAYDGPNDRIPAPTARPSRHEKHVAHTTHTAAAAHRERVAKKATAKKAPVRRSVGYSTSMTDLERHGSHNQKSHGNRLGRPENVAGKTGLAKATAALADKPEQGPARAPKRRELSAADIENILKGDRPSYMGNRRRNEDHMRLLTAAGVGDEQAREILKDLHADPDRPWAITDIGYALHNRTQDEANRNAEAAMATRLALATPTAFARLLGTDGQPALVKSKPVAAVFEAMQANGWKMTSANSQTGWHAFSSADGNKTIKVLIGKGVVIYDDRINKISGVKALAYVRGDS